MYLNIKAQKSLLLNPLFVKDKLSRPIRKNGVASQSLGSLGKGAHCIGDQHRLADNVLGQGQLSVDMSVAQFKSLAYRWTWISSLKRRGTVTHHVLECPLPLSRNLAKLREHGEQAWARMFIHIILKDSDFSACTGGTMAS